ncbi:uncharacterized protein STEHIDRAFT_163325 [Stereum hirsutum FP-91666 SS1]|uniref:Uncharacterized protein n=1 Tax=Stereum hirsutum (strain FP-91666) TaxID=721885 RepID=R7RWL7_STEHR|nr:uncharacterized protein STEHIDRAFT_163325 [Stereum hirsutum FP-91666 SS1]EIM79766.1 hypothetical protein STEHIDRAFT_163325 [Stereum hirsutum FP-91666 SS1]
MPPTEGSKTTSMTGSSDKVFPAAPLICQKSPSMKLPLACTHLSHCSPVQRATYLHQTLPIGSYSGPVRSRKVDPLRLYPGPYPKPPTLQDQHPETTQARADEEDEDEDDAEPRGTDGEPSGEEPGQDIEPAGNGEDNRGHIPKPQGENGRPGRGGYSSYIKQECDLKLNVKKTITGQNPALVQEVVEEVRARHPSLDDYEDHWPVHDVIKAHLKYTSSRARKQKV